MLTQRQVRFLVNKLVAFMGSCDGREYVQISSFPDEVFRLRSEVTRLHQDNVRLATLLLCNESARAACNCNEITT